MLSSPADLPATENSVCVKCLQVTYNSISLYLIFLLMPSIAFMSSGLSSKSNTWKEGTITLPLPQGTSLSLGTGGVSSWMETRRGGREAVSVLSFQENKPGNLCWILTSASHTFSFSVHLTNITAHQSLIFLSESLQIENKLKSFFSNHTTFRYS